MKKGTTTTTTTPTTTTTTTTTRSQVNLIFTERSTPLGVTAGRYAGGQVISKPVIGFVSNTLKKKVCVGCEALLISRSKGCLHDNQT